MSFQNGFTLIEVLTASLISTIVAGALLSVLSMTNNHIKDGAAHLRTGQMQTVVSDQLHTNAHAACGVKSTGESLIDPFTTPTYDLGVASAKEIVFCTKAGLPIARYKINSVANYLEEWRTDPLGAGPVGYYPFQVGNDTAFLNGALSEFNLQPGRRGFTATLLFQSRDRSYTFPHIVETILCRNTSR